MAGWTLVTGASAGLGAEFARIAAKDGRNVILAARRLDKLEALAGDLRASGVDAVAIAADLSAPDGAATLWKAATGEGRRVDFLVNNAGLGRHGPFGSGTEADGGRPRERASLHVNVMALTELMSLAAPEMKAAGGGRILNVASVAGFMPGPNMAVYHASKAYVINLTRAVRAELAGSGVAVAALCPGPTRTSFFDEADMNAARVTKMFPLPTAASVAQAGYDGALAGRAVIVPGLMNKINVWSAKLLPAALITPIAGFIMGKPS